MIHRHTTGALSPAFNACEHGDLNKNNKDTTSNDIETPYTAKFGLLVSI